MKQNEWKIIVILLTRYKHFVVLELIKTVTCARVIKKVPLYCQNKGRKTYRHNTLTLKNVRYCSQKNVQTYTTDLQHN